MNITIFSGGQTGVDRAALDAALDNNVDCTGWCPSGRLAEDGPIPQVYPLNETSGADPAERTELNVKDSDGTLIIHDGKLDEGTALTISLCAIHSKPVHEVDLSGTYNTEHTYQWIRKYQLRKINIAGPRESHAPGIYQQALKYMKILLKGL